MSELEKGKRDTVIMGRSYQHSWGRVMAATTSGKAALATASKLRNDESTPSTALAEYGMVTFR